MNAPKPSLSPHRRFALAAALVAVALTTPLAALAQAAAAPSAASLPAGLTQVTSVEGITAVSYTHLTLPTKRIV